MEDHLRNKGRLQREWEALCRYEAEPGARDAALQPECNNLNRQTAPLPFDHSRVVLNHLANAEGMDYINASTIVSVTLSFCFVNSYSFLPFLFQRLITIPAPPLTLPHKDPSPPLLPTFGR